MTGSPDIVLDAIEAWRTGPLPLVIGLCGAQGSGKSTLAAGLASRFAAMGVTCAVLSLDDLYLAPADRPTHIHPLFATRGPPGTHDTALGIEVLVRLKAGQGAALPRFDKAIDAPLPRSQWPVTQGADLILFEGWCVGARPQDESDLIEPVNDLERRRDPEGLWRHHVNAQLAGPYRDLFARIDRLVLLAAPGFEVVQAWRTEQEHALSRILEKEGRTGKKVMTDADIAQFIQHYERLTRYILAEMPARADLTLRLGPDRSPS